MSLAVISWQAGRLAHAAGVRRSGVDPSIDGELLACWGALSSTCCCCCGCAQRRDVDAELWMLIGLHRMDAPTGE